MIEVGDQHPFVLKLEFGGKGVEIRLTLEQMREPEARFRMFDEAVKALLFSHGIPVT